MFEKLIQVFSGNHPLQSTGDLFFQMQVLVRDMIRTASGVYWGSVITKAERKQLFDTDARVNALQREIRKQILIHLTGPQTADAPYGLLLMSLVKDTERLGDYAKNLSEVHQLTGLGAGDVPQGPLRDQLRAIADFVEMAADQFAEVYSDADQQRAQALMREGKRISKACDRFVREVAQSNVSAALAVNLTLAGRFYKRIAGHVTNVLSSVVMPLHSVDYLESDEVPAAELRSYGT